MSAVVAPDIDDAIVAYLLTDTDLQAIVGTKIYAELPPGVAYPCVTARRISGRSGHPRWLGTVTIEVAGWGHRNDAHGRKDARDACEYAVRALQDTVNLLSQDALLCGPLATNDPRSVPDQVSPGVSNPRFIAEVTLSYHPAPAGS